MKFNTNFKKIDEIILKMTKDKKMDKHTLFFIVMNLISNEIFKMLDQQEVKDKTKGFNIQDYVNDIEHLLISINKEKRGFVGLKYKTILDESYISYGKEKECKLSDGDIEETMSFLSAKILTEEEIPLYAWQRREDEKTQTTHKNTKEENKKFIEKDLENLLIKDLSVIEEGLTLIKNQYSVEDGYIDILARDKNNNLCIIELKITRHDIKVIEQCVYYPTQFEEPTRMITIAPDYSNKITKSLESLGYIEMKTYTLNDGKLTISDYK